MRCIPTPNETRETEAAARCGLGLLSTNACAAHLSAQQRMKVLQPAMIGGSVGREDRPLHLGMIESPVTSTGLGGGEALALKFAPGFLHLTACRQGSILLSRRPTARSLDRPQHVVDGTEVPRRGMLHCASSFCLLANSSVTEGGSRAVRLFQDVRDYRANR